MLMLQIHSNSCDHVITLTRKYLSFTWISWTSQHFFWSFVSYAFSRGRLKKITYWLNCYFLGTIIVFFFFYYFTLFSSLVTTHKNPEGTCVQNKVNFFFVFFCWTWSQNKVYFFFTKKHFAKIVFDFNLCIIY